MSEATKQRISTPSSAQPMPGLSERAKKMLTPARHGFCVPIEPPGAGLVRYAKTKASI